MGVSMHFRPLVSDAWKSKIMPLSQIDPVRWIRRYEDIKGS